MMDPRTLARALGGTAIGSNVVVAPGPGHSSSDRSMSVRIDPGARDGFVVNSFAGDDWRACRDHVLDRLGGPTRHSGQPQAPGSATGVQRGAGTARGAAADRIATAARLWAEGRPIDGTPIATYLRVRVPNLDDAPFDRTVLRYHEACPFRIDDSHVVRLPAMLAAMVDIRTNAFSGVHRTALKPDGTAKSDHPGLGNPKRMLGIASGACVKLTPDEDVTTGLHVAEGIETALACMAMGFVPLWAALSAGAIASFPVLSGIEAVTVFADNDSSGTGLQAARDCACRWTQASAEATIAWPPEPGSDWADGMEVDR